MACWRYCQVDWFRGLGLAVVSNHIHMEAEKLTPIIRSALRIRRPHGVVTVECEYPIIVGYIQHPLEEAYMITR